MNEVKKLWEPGEASLEAVIVPICKRHPTSPPPFPQTRSCLHSLNTKELVVDSHVSRSQDAALAGHV